MDQSVMAGMETFIVPKFYGAKQFTLKYPGERLISRRSVGFGKMLSYCLKSVLKRMP